MATLSFNPTRIPHKPISKITSFSKPSEIPFPLSLKPSKNHVIPLHFQSNIITKLSVSTQEEEVETEKKDYEEDDPTTEMVYLDPETDPDSIVEWELDFCSRPILDVRGKKVWELVVCDDSLSLQFTKYFPNNVINSITLKDAIVSISEDLGVPLPERIRFFRSQMQTIITKACKEIGIKPIPSKRCISLLLWLEERYETVYTRHPGFQKGAKPLLALDNPFPMELPDNLFGEKWAFVQLPYSAVREEIASLETSFFFGASLDLDLLGIEIDDKTMIPGLAVASSRAEPLAAWMNGLEVVAIEADTSRACLILSVGIATRYVYATYKKTPVTTAEAEAWEAAKKACGGLHFLAIQNDLDSDDCVGFWLLLDLPPPPV
ncbi:hypothetical protein POPTR_009G059600v4 [Populus trichocarpa]|uniref:PI-PLC Y-box domain-containing protein n=1 Tax=Populus trichocarpa TaxID=3694 RepID=B9HNQ9_POPTR|nr:protein TAB2 homolog, chloroplastic [Populus trichocarpa]PNT19853.1 hypothetical protein POPTR_009G059600v4 [Populus trichocarpa]|eukprot:XP_002313311.2 protein TAB2 homolog, chloroplastic [Populus trichocarpa]